MKAAFFKKFERELHTEYNIFAMSLISKPADGADFTPEQKAWAEAYDAGYFDALACLDSVE